MCSSLVAATEKNNSKRAALQETQTIRSSVEVEDAEPNSKGDESDQAGKRCQALVIWYFSLPAFSEFRTVGLSSVLVPLSFAPQVSLSETKVLISLA